MEYLNKLDKFLHQDNVIAKGAGFLEQKSGFPRRYFALGFIAFIALYLMFGWGSQFLANFIGFLYPAYASVKAIESHQKDDDTKWLTYWVVYAKFCLLESFTDCLLWWIPFYAFLKCAMLIYLMAPIQNNGSIILYNNVIRPFVLKHQGRIDSAIGQVKDAAEQAAREARDSDIYRRGTDMASDMMAGDSAKSD